MISVETLLFLAVFISMNLRNDKYCHNISGENVEYISAVIGVAFYLQECMLNSSSLSTDNYFAESLVDIVVKV